MLIKITVSFVTLKTLCMIILNLSNTLNILSMSLSLYKNCFMLDLIQLKAFSFILLTANNIFQSSFIVLKAKYSFSWNNQFFNSVRWSLKIFDLIILMLLNFSDVVVQLLLIFLFFISTLDELFLITVFFYCFRLC